MTKRFYTHAADADAAADVTLADVFDPRDRFPVRVPERMIVAPDPLLDTTQPLPDAPF